MKEKTIENEILQYLEMRNKFPIKIERQGTFDPTRRVYRKSNNKYKRNGVCDVLCWHRGKSVFFEVKVPEKIAYIDRHYDRLRIGLVKSEKHITEQIAFMDNVIKQGSFAFFVSSIEEVENSFSKVDQFLDSTQAE